jgi:HSP20 family protein
MLYLNVHPKAAYCRPANRVGFGKTMENAISEFEKNFATAFVKTNPAVNVTETPDNFRIEVAAPGLEKKDFNVAVENDLLTISSKKTAEEKTDSEKFTRREFNYFEFKRSFQLPDTVDVNAINASYEAGILTLTLPKKEEAKPLQKNIEIL